MYRELLFAAFFFAVFMFLLYELFEWGLTMVLSPQDAAAYNGQQGDMWDAHMDMLLATLGALAAWPRRRAERLQPAASVA